MRKLRKILSLLLVMVVVMSSFQSIKVEAKESNNEHWANKELNKWVNKGWLKGDKNGNIMPNKSITRAEFVTLINAMMNYTKTSDKIKKYQDINVNDWYYNEFDIALTQGYINGLSNEKLAPNVLVTREQAMAIISRLKNIENTNIEVLKNVVDKKDISSWAINATANCINEGFITGYKQMVKPKDNITKAEAIVLLDRVNENDRYFSFEGTFGGTKQKISTYNNVYVLHSKVSIENAKINNDLHLTKEIGEGEAKLANVDIKSNLFVNGGGENSLYFTDISVGSKIIVNKTNDKVRIYFKGDSKAKLVVLESGAILVTKENKKGDIKVVEIPETVTKTEEVELVGDFEEVINSAKNTKLNIHGNIEKLKLNESAFVEGKAEIKSYEKSNNADIKINTKDENNGNIKIDSNATNESSSSSHSGSSSHSSHSGGSSHEKVATVSSIEIIKQLKKVEYKIGEALELTGLEVQAKYSDETLKTIENDKLKLSGYDNTKEGKQIITITYEGKTTTFEINVLPEIENGSTITELIKPNAIIVENGTPFEKLTLSKTVKIKGIKKDETKFDSAIDISWEKPANYDAKILDEAKYTIKGIVELPENVTTGNNITIKASENASTSDNIIVKAEKDIEISVDLTVSAKNWNVNFVTPKDVTPITKQVVSHKNKATKPEELERTGYDFVGFKVGDEIYNFESEVVSDLSINAVFKKKEFIVTLNVEDKKTFDIPSEIKVLYQDNIKMEQYQDKNLTLMWFTDEARTESFDSTKPITTNVELYGKWMENIELLNAAKKVTFDMIKGENKGDWGVSKDLELIKSIDDGIDISWSSNEESIVSTEGKVKNTTDKSINVVLTARLSKNNQYVEKEIEITVLSKGLDIDLSNYIDPRFEEGYPKIVFNKEGSPEIKVKLKKGVATLDNPVELFVAHRDIDKHDETKYTYDPEKVYMGLSYIEYDWTNNVYFERITDNKTVSIETSLYNEEFAFVLRQNEKFESKKVTEILFSKEDILELKQYFNEGEIISNKDKVIVYYDDLEEPLDENSIPNLSDYILYDENDREVKDIIKNISIANSKDYDEYDGSVVLTLNKEADIKKVSYEGSAIRFKIHNEIKSTTFENRKTKVATNEISIKAIGSDKKHMVIAINGIGDLNDQDYKFIIKQNGKIKTYEINLTWSHYMYSEKYITLDEPLSSSDFMVQLDGTYTSLDLTKINPVYQNTSYDMLLDELKLEPIVKLIEHKDNATLNVISNIKIENDLSPIYFKMDIDGTIYQLIGAISIDSEKLAENKYNNEIKSYDDDSYNNYILEKAKKALEENKKVKLIYTKGIKGIEMEEVIKDISGMPLSNGLDKNNQIIFDVTK